MNAGSNPRNRWPVIPAFGGGITNFMRGDEHVPQGAIFDHPGTGGLMICIN